MKTIETQICEDTFLTRMDKLCVPKVRHNKEYRHKDTFVMRKKDRRIWLCKHYAQLGRNGGCMSDCIYGKYDLDEQGHVTVRYRFGQRLGYLIPFLLTFVLGFSLWCGALWDGIGAGKMSWNGLAVTTLIWGLGLTGMLIRSKKDRVMLEERLYEICDVEYEM